jgi:hypothetical protein
MNSMDAKPGFPVLIQLAAMPASWHNLVASKP